MRQSPSHNLTLYKRTTSNISQHKCMASLTNTGTKYTRSVIFVASVTVVLTVATSHLRSSLECSVKSVEGRVKISEGEQGTSIGNAGQKLGVEF